jgi:hypothetical protein
MYVLQCTLYSIELMHALALIIWNSLYSIYYLILRKFENTILLRHYCLDDEKLNFFYLYIYIQMQLISLNMHAEISAFAKFTFYILYNKDRFLPLSISLTTA